LLKRSNIKTSLLKLVEVGKYTKIFIVTLKQVGDVNEYDTGLLNNTSKTKTFIVSSF